MSSQCSRTDSKGYTSIYLQARCPITSAVENSSGTLNYYRSRYTVPKLTYIRSEKGSISSQNCVSSLFETRHMYVWFLFLIHFPRSFISFFPCFWLLLFFFLFFFSFSSSAKLVSQPLGTDRTCVAPKITTHTRACAHSHTFLLSIKTYLS